MTVHQWGEAPHGVWELEIHNKGRYMGKFPSVHFFLILLPINTQRNLFAFSPLVVMEIVIKLTLIFFPFFKRLPPLFLCKITW